MMILMFFEINFGSANAYVQLDNLEVIFCNILGLLKLLSFRIYANNLTRNFSSAMNDYLAIDTEEKRMIMRRHAFMGRFICYSILFLAYLASSIFMLMPMIVDDMEVQVNISTKNQLSGLPVPFTFLGEVHMSTGLYILTSTVQYIILMLTCTCNCGNKLIY